MPELQYMIFTVIGLALLFDFINGFHDTANAIATSVSTRAIAPRNAILMAAVLNFLGAMYSTGVAKTIGGDIVSSAMHVDEHVLIAALVSNFADLAVVKNAFAGVRVCVCVLICNAVVKLWKKAVVDKVTMGIFLAVVAGNLLLDLSPVVFVVLAGVAGVVLGDLRRKQK